MAVKTITLGEIKARIDELESIEQPIEVVEAGDGGDFDQEAFDELEALRDLESTLAWCWDDDNKVLIREADFTEYTMEELYEMGDLKKGGIADGLIDTDKAAEVLCQDYRMVTYDEESYMVRN